MSNIKNKNDSAFNQSQRWKDSDKHGDAKVEGGAPSATVWNVMEATFAPSKDNVVMKTLPLKIPGSNAL